MMKDTEALLGEIKSATDIDKYLEDNKISVSDISFADYLHELLAQKGLAIADVQRRGQFTNYIYELFRGEKTPARDTALQLCFGFSLSPEEAQRLLRMARVGALYPKDKRDSIILFGLKERLACAALNDLLDAKQMELIF